MRFESVMALGIFLSAALAFGGADTTTSSGTTGPGGVSGSPANSYGNVGAAQSPGANADPSAPPAGRTGATSDRGQAQAYPSTEKAGNTTAPPSTTETGAATPR